jgi:hypothetical protein
MAKKKQTKRPSKPIADPFAWHEALDRSCIAMEHFDRFVIEHDVIQRDPELTKIAEDASALLYHLYNTIADKAPHMQ